MALTYITTPEQLRDALEAMPSLHGGLCLDLEWNSHAVETLPLSLLQFNTTGSSPVIIDAILLRDAGVDLLGFGPPAYVSLRELIVSQQTVKVLHDARQDAKVLEKRGCQLGKCFDTQIAHEQLTGEGQKGLGYVLDYWLSVPLAKSDEMKRRMRQIDFWERRPLDAITLEYAAADVRHLPALYQRLVATATERGKLEEIFNRSAFPREDPNTRKRQEIFKAAVAFGQLLRADDALRERCNDKEGFLA
eukprot:2244007-Prymnesium_polylepis.1